MYLVFKKIFFKPLRIISLLLLSFMFFVMLQALPVFRFMKSAYRLAEPSLARYVEIFQQYIFQPFSYISFSQQLLTILLALALAVNIFLFVAYFNRQRKVFAGKSFFASIAGMFLGLFGVGCVSCGALVVAPVLTFLGLGSYVQNFIEHSTLISFIGLLVILVSIFYILRVLSRPLVCK